MKLLVPVDGSSASINAVKKSIEIAKKYDFSIKLICIVASDVSRGHKRNEQLWRQVDGSAITGRPMTIDDDVLTSKLRESSDELLDSIVAELDFGDIKVEKEVSFGEPYVKILETAKDEKFDLIVIGNRGFSKIKSFFLGSVTQRVISEAQCPVLVIHADAES
jgi:nucleotide-binding universal stress UspA family protein